MKDNKFNFGVDIDIDEESFEKATKGNASDRYKNMIISGLASDSSIDQEGQSLLPSGYDFSYFLKSGKINLEHFTTRKQDPSSWLGEPIEAYVKGEEFFIKAKLWEHQPKARAFYDTIVAMKKSGSKRRAGFSIEGKAIEKDPFNPNKILKARIINCAVTLDPVNQNSWLDISKGQQSKDFIEPVYDEKSYEGSPYLMQYELEDGSVLTVNKDFSIKITKVPIKKTMDTGSMAPLMPESLDKKLTNLESAKAIMKSINSNTINKSIGEKILRKILLHD